MGGCLSCCCGGTSDGDYRSPPSRHSGLNRSNNRSFDASTFRQGKQHTAITATCEVCGAEIDPALLEGHREVCRANHLRALLAKNAALLSDANLRPMSSSTRLHDDLLGAGEKELCIVCMDRPRCYAFLPCGHICCCEECTKSLDQCPLCRQPREGLCYVSSNVASQYECKHCHELIAPTLFDGHREVCGLRQRQKQREAEEAAAAAATTTQLMITNGCENGKEGCAMGSADVDAKADILMNASGSSPGPSPPPQQKASTDMHVPARSHTHVCLECGKRYNQLMVCVPCGHRVLCYACAKRRTTCPVCVSEIRNTVVAFD
jgi:hypothetical protein